MEKEIHKKQNIEPEKEEENQFKHLLQSPQQNSLKNGYFNTAQQIVDDQILD